MSSSGHMTINCLDFADRRGRQHSFKKGSFKQASLGAVYNQLIFINGNTS